MLSVNLLTVGAKWQVHLEPHAIRVVHYALALAESLNLGTEAVRLVRDVAYLHDIGKLLTPLGILLADRALSADEKRVMDLHAENGEELIRNGGCSALWDKRACAPAMAGWIALTGGDRLAPTDEIATGVRHIHEWHNGTGYPDMLQGCDTPVASRVVAFADAFDAMTAPGERPYRAPLSFDEGLAELERAKDRGQLDWFFRVKGLRTEVNWRITYGLNRA